DRSLGDQRIGGGTRAAWGEGPRAVGRERVLALSPAGRRRDCLRSPAHGDLPADRPQSDPGRTSRRRAQWHGPGADDWRSERHTARGRSRRAPRTGATRKRNRGITGGPPGKEVTQLALPAFVAT